MRSFRSGGARIVRRFRGDLDGKMFGDLVTVDTPADLLADPQLREKGDGIDWYAARSGSVRRLADLDENERADVLATVESHLEAIRRLHHIRPRSVEEPCRRRLQRPDEARREIGLRREAQAAVNRMLASL